MTSQETEQPGVTVQGRVADGYEEVLESFATTVEGRPGGAATSLVVRGEVVVDLWAGSAGTQAWGPGTRAVVFSSTKGLVALSVLRLVAAGSLDLDAPVARYWPEFAQQGKGSVTVRHALGHRAGVPVVDGISTREQVLSWSAMTAALAAQRPLWEPGTEYEYHSLTYGWLAGEIVRRVDGRSPGTYLREEFSTPLGLRTAIGVPADEQADIATILPAPPIDPQDPYGDPAELGVRAISINSSLTFPGGGPRHDWNDADVLAAEIPGANGVSSARDLASLYAAVVGTGRVPGLIADEVLVDGMRVVSEGQDFSRGRPGATPRWGAGLEVSSPVRAMFSAGSFGHAGAGGQLAFGDIGTRAGFAYLTNRMGDEQDSRAEDVTAAARRVLTRLRVS